MPVRPSSALFHALHSLVGSLGQLGPHRLDANPSIATDLLAMFEASTASACVDALGDASLPEPLGLQIIADVHYVRAIRDGAKFESDVWTPLLELVQPQVRPHAPLPVADVSQLTSTTHKAAMDVLHAETDATLRSIRALIAPLLPPASSVLEPVVRAKSGLLSTASGGPRSDAGGGAGEYRSPIGVAKPGPRFGLLPVPSR